VKKWKQKKLFEPDHWPTVAIKHREDTEWLFEDDIFTNSFPIKILYKHKTRRIPA
jgi:hypothetical protein